MDQVVTEQRIGLPDWVARRPLTVAEYHRMGEDGILHENDRVELIEGELIQMVPISSDHSGTVNVLAYLFFKAIGEHAVVAVQQPVRLNDHNEPQPDLALLKPRADHYRSDHPLPPDVMLIIEVAVSSLPYDRTIKLPLYARHGIPEVWIVDVAAKAIEVHRTPSKDGYADMTRLVPGDTITTLALPDVTLPVSEILG
jgi:Uma2 family endonuclease